MTDATPATPEETTAEHRLAVEDFKHLPPPVKLEDTIATQDPNAPADPTFGRDPQTDFLLRNAG